MMLHKTSIKTRMGWVSVFEENGKIFQIKFGKTKKKINSNALKKFNLSPRHVGKICSQNKLVLVIPCHRVVRSDGTLGGFSSKGGIRLKKKLLEFEKRS